MRARSSTTAWTRSSSRTTATRRSPPAAWRPRRPRPWPCSRTTGAAPRALADAPVAPARATGDATPSEDVKRVRSAVPDVPILVGSGVTPETAPELLSLADALIVGTSLKRDGDVSAPVDPARVRRLVDAVGGR